MFLIDNKRRSFNRIYLQINDLSLYIPIGGSQNWKNIMILYVECSFKSNLLL